MSNKKIDAEILSILNKFDITRAPVHVEKIAIKMDLDIQPADLGPKVSGALIINDGKATIGVNQNESKVRRRFTIAHELGHYILHRSTNNFFVEKMVLFRNTDTSLGEEKKEKQANAFAAGLLMPQTILETEIEIALKNDSIENDDDLISYLAKKFEVSEIAMTYRLSNLNLLH